MTEFRRQPKLMFLMLTLTLTPTPTLNVMVILTFILIGVQKGIRRVILGEAV